LVVIATAWWVKERYWRFIDISTAPSTIASATGLGRRGKVRMLEPPNTEENYLLKEMGFRVARKHRVRLRMIARVTAFIVPFLATLIALFAASILFAGVAVASAALGLVVERWLFFAEAKHTVMLYYGAEAV
jgi:DMSO reductase anchor subunit